MTDDPTPPAPDLSANETPMQKALRLKKEAQAAAPKAPRGKVGPRASAALSAGLSKPWMKR